MMKFQSILNRTPMSSVSKHPFDTPLQSYRLDVGEFPSTEEGIEALLRPPLGKGEFWKGPYLLRIPEDSWGNPFIYQFPGSSNPEEYELISLGPDGVTSSDDKTIDQIIAEQAQSKPNITMIQLGSLLFGIVALFVIVRFLSGWFQNRT